MSGDDAVPDALRHQGVHLPGTTRFDVALLAELQEQYAARPPVPAGREPEAPDTETAERVLDELVRRLGPLDGARVLQIGRGEADLLGLLVDRAGCETVGVDVVERDSWARRPELGWRRHDVAQDPNDELGTFDVVVSVGSWERLVHPFAALRAVRGLLGTDGRAYLSAGLHRGPTAARQHPETRVPWAHLLFQDDVVAEYHRGSGSAASPSPAWANKLTSAHYLTYFDRAGLRPEEVDHLSVPLDEPLYRRFEDVLGRYPVFDLERETLRAVLVPGDVVDPADEAEELRRLRKRISKLERQRNRARDRVRGLEASASWRATAPLRRLLRSR